MNNPRLITLLRLRQPPLTIQELAQKIGTGRSHLTQVLAGTRRGGETWPKLRAELTDAEYKQARQGARLE